jgi:hypothetical protein
MLVAAVQRRNLPPPIDMIMMAIIIIFPWVEAVKFINGKKIHNE